MPADLGFTYCYCNMYTNIPGRRLFRKKKPSLEPNFNPMTAVGKNLNVLCCFFQFFITALHKVQNSHNHSTHFDFTQDRRENDTSIQPQWPSSRLPASNLEMMYHFSQTGLK